MVKFKTENGLLIKLMKIIMKVQQGDVVGKAIGYSYGPAFQI